MPQGSRSTLLELRLVTIASWSDEDNQLKGLAAPRCEETKFTPFALNRARGAVLSDAVRVACRTCAAMHARRRLHGAQRPWGGEKAPDGVHGSRCEEAPFTLCAMSRAQIADS